ncbi:hypothetical protein AB1Y20_008714 [Prymnesium parvum]|uniref:Uncharacterized protein n=1 Tax=Prymnesium parvum TaxID=97485 RepID=A0AB34ITU1_PRYPA
MQRAAGAVGLVALFVLIETRKPLLLRQAWMAGALALPFSGALLAISLSTGAAAKAVCVLGSATLLAASLVGWWVCVNKKDDLVLQRALVRFRESLVELDAAEERLRSALETMLACDTDMQKLSDDIAQATREAQAQLDAIRAHNRRAMVGMRRSLMDDVLVELADVDGSMMMGPTERRKLMQLITNMAGRPEEELMHFREQLGLSTGAAGQDDAREYSTQDILTKLDSLNAFEVIMGLDKRAKQKRRDA